MQRRKGYLLPVLPLVLPLPEAPLVLGDVVDVPPVLPLVELPLPMPLLLGDVVLEVELPPVLDFWCATACSASESLPSLSVSSLLNSFSCGEPFTSSRDRNLSLSLSRDWNIAAAPLSLVLPALALPPDDMPEDDPLVEELGEVVLLLELELGAVELPELGEVVLLLELELGKVVLLEDLSLLLLLVCACAVAAKAAAMAAAIRVMRVMNGSPG